MIGFLFFGLIWACNFLKDQTAFICMCSASQYYFSSNRDREGSASIGLSAYFAFAKHAGSFALGSLLFTICQILNMICESMKKEANEEDSGAAKAAAACMACITKCLEDIIEYISRLSYAYMSISGQSFCTSAWNGFLLNLKHLAKFYLAIQLSSVLIFMGQMLIVSINAGLFYVILKIGFKDVASGIEYIALPVTFVVFLSFVITSIFLGFFDEAVLATVTSLGVDMDLNGEPQFGSPSFHEKMREIF